MSAEDPQERRAMTPDLLLLLGRIDGKLDQFQLQLRDLTKNHDDMDARVSSLETSRAYLLGIAGAVSIIAGALSSKIVEFVTGGAP